MKTRLNIREAFEAAFHFLDMYYNQTHSRQINCLLSDMDMRTWADGHTADPTVWEDWLICMNGDNELTIQEAYKAVAEFVSERYSLEPDEYVVALIEGMQFLPDNKPQNPFLWQQWLKAVEKV